jgi:hypothetical protein
MSDLLIQFLASLKVGERGRVAKKPSYFQYSTNRTTVGKHLRMSLYTSKEICLLSMILQIEPHTSQQSA